MALEGGKYSGKIAVLAGLGIVAATVGWNVFGDKSEKSEVAEVQKDDESGGEVDEEVASDVDVVQAGVAQQLKFPPILPGLHGVTQEINASLLDENRNFLVDVDAWLHFASEPIDFSGYSDEVKEVLIGEKNNFDAKVFVTKQLMAYDSAFWGRKVKLEAAFPNYELVSEPRDDGTFFVHLLQKPGLLGLDGRTSSGYEPSGALGELEITDFGGAIEIQNNGGETYLVKDYQSLILYLEKFFKTSELRRKWQNDSPEESLSEYLKALE